MNTLTKNSQQRAFFIVLRSGLCRGSMGQLSNTDELGREKNYLIWESCTVDTQHSSQHFSIMENRVRNCPPVQISPCKLDPRSLLVNLLLRWVNRQVCHLNSLDPTVILGGLDHDTIHIQLKQAGVLVFVKTRTEQTCCTPLI